MTAELFCFLGSLIYLELIEMHFCQFDYNVKKNIKLRAENDIIQNGLIDDESSSYEKYECEFKDYSSYSIQELTKTMN